MRALLERIGSYVTLKAKSDEPAPGKDPEPPAGCALTWLWRGAFIVAVVVALIVSLLTRSSDPSGAAAPTSLPSSIVPGVASDTEPPPGSESAGSYSDPDNPGVVVPAAGTWLVDNGMFVPNCGPDDPEPSTTYSTGTIAVWSSGAVLELAGPDGTPLTFQRTDVSDDSVVYVGSIGFVEMELIFESPLQFDATISYDGDDQCVRRSARGTLTAGDDAMQHGAEDPESAGPSTDLGINGAKEESIAVVTIGTDTYEFTIQDSVGTCDPDFFGGFHAVLYSPGFVGSFNIDLVPDGSRTSTLSMTARDLDLDLVADEDGEWAAVAPGSSAVRDFTIDEVTATGSVSFINEDRAFNSANYPLASIEATFFVSCGSS